MEGAWDRPRDQIVHPFLFNLTPGLGPKANTPIPTPPGPHWPNWLTTLYLVEAQKRTPADIYRLKKRPRRGRVEPPNLKKARMGVTHPSLDPSRELESYFATKLTVWSCCRVNV